jgi:DNA-binding NarL/FixJ family response regulator
MSISESQPTIRVVLADDHAVVRAGTRQFLELEGDIRVVAEAENGEQAKKLIETHQPDVAVLDIQMPGATGIEIARWIQSHYPSIGVLILTAYEDDPYVLAVIRAGANGYVLKTAPPEEVLRAVRDVNEGKSVLDPAITRNLLVQRQEATESGPIEQLTDRETEVLKLVGRGHTNKAIGLKLSISDRTVQGHLAHIFTKLQATSRTEAVMRAVSLGWLPDDLGELKNRAEK